MPNFLARLEFKDGEPVSFQVEYDDKQKPRVRILNRCIAFLEVGTGMRKEPTLCCLGKSQTVVLKVANGARTSKTKHDID